MAELREDLSELKLIIIDEVSLISSDMLYKLDAKLREIFNLRNKTPFGGIGIMLVGDLLQIQPVTGDYIFATPKKPKNQQAYENENLWELFEPWILKYNHRQGASSEWANVLNRFREGIVNEEDLNLLKERETDDDHNDFNYIDGFWGYCSNLCPKEPKETEEPREVKKENKSLEEDVEKKPWFIIVTVLGSLTILMLLILLGLCFAGKLRCRYFKNETTNHVILTFREKS